MSYAKDKATRKRSAGAGKVPKRTSRWGVDPGEVMLGDLRDVPGLAAVLQAVALAGDAVTLSTTSDGGAWALTLIHDGQFDKAYPHSQDELNACFEAIATTYGPVPGDA